MVKKRIILPRHIWHCEEQSSSCKNETCLTQILLDVKTVIEMNYETLCLQFLFGSNKSNVVTLQPDLESVER